MSLPQHFNIVAIAENHKGGTDLAAAAAGILRNLGDVGYAPYYVASSTYKLPSKLSSFALRRNILLSQPIKPFLLNASRIDLWLALDTEGEATSRRTISESGPAPKSFYRKSFPDPVVLCKVTTLVPSVWSEENYNQWFDSLTEDLTSLSQRI